MQVSVEEIETHKQEEMDWLVLKSVSKCVRISVSVRYDGTSFAMTANWGSIIGHWLTRKDESAAALGSIQDEETGDLRCADGAM